MRGALSGSLVWLLGCGGAGGRSDTLESSEASEAVEASEAETSASADTESAADAVPLDIPEERVDVAVRPSNMPRGFVIAPPDQAQAPECGTVHGGVVFDTNLDGWDDVVLATDDGLRVLVGDPYGRFTLARVVDPASGAQVPLRPGGRGEVRGVVSTGTGFVVACTTGASELRLGPTPTGLAVAGRLPVRDGACRALAVGDVSAETGVSLLALVEGLDGVALRRWVDGVADEALLSAAGPALPVGMLEPAAPGCAFERLEQDPLGRGIGRLTAVLSVPELVATLPIAADGWPVRLRLRVRGDGTPFLVEPVLVGSDGARVLGPALEVPAANWAEVDVETSAWGAPSPALAAVGLRVSGAPELAGRLYLDDVVVELPDRLTAVVAAFDPPARFRWDDASALVAGDVDGDGAADAVVLRQSKPPVLVRSYGGPVASPLSAGGQVGFSAAALLDAESDGDRDVFLVSPAGQDRLLVGDGYGQFLDTTLGAVPVDGANGTSALAADLDGDGHDDLVIGNRGGTDRHYRAKGDGRFGDATPFLGFDSLDTAVVLALDLDRDGDLDLMSVAADGNVTPLVRVAIPREDGS